MSGYKKTTPAGTEVEKVLPSKKELQKIQSVTCEEIKEFKDTNVAILFFYLLENAGFKDEEKLWIGTHLRSFTHQSAKLRS